MDFDVADVIEYEGKDWIILTEFVEDNKRYAFVNNVNLDTGEVGQDYYLMELKFEKITDENVINKLFPKVQENLKKEFENNDINLDDVINNQ